MQYFRFSLALAITLSAPGVLGAQDDSMSTGGHAHHAMMMQHHSAATVDQLMSLRDTLKLTGDQLDRLADLRGRFAQAESHGMHGAGQGMGMMMGEGMMGQGMKGQGMMMGQGMQMGPMAEPRPHIAFDRVPGKMVPRIHRPPAAHCPMCPFGILTQSQRELAHQLLGRQQGPHGGHHHQG